MTRTSVTLQYPAADSTNSVQTLKPTETSVVQADGVEIKKAFACKDNSLIVVIKNTANASKNIIIKKGSFPNAVLGDLSVSLTSSSTNLIKIENPSRFEQTDGSLLIDFESGFTGTIYATGKRAGLKPVN